MLADRRYRYGDPKSPCGFLADMVFWVDRFPRPLERPGPAARSRPQASAAGSRRSGISVWVFDTDLISRARHAAKGRGCDSRPDQSDWSSVIRFGLWRRSATGNSVDRSRHLSTNVVTSSLKRTGNFGSDAPRGARAFQSWSRPPLEYGVASADLKPSIPWARSRFLERKRLR
jgi:hypothetical protein